MYRSLREASGAYSPRAYDYVSVGDGWIYVVRGKFSEGGAVVAKPIYRPSKGKWIKHRESLDGSPQPPPYPRLEYGTHMDYILSSDDIVRVWPRAEVPLDSVSFMPTRVQDLASNIRDVGGKTFLFGSRRLEIATDKSDWDILVTAPMLPSVLVESVAPRARLRRLTVEECHHRASRYAISESISSLDSLSRIMEKCTMYLRHHGGEIGVFFISEGDSSIPYLVSTAANWANRISGTILPSAGSSHLMPRWFRMRLIDGNEVSVGTLSWELAGLEDAAGSVAVLDGARFLESAAFWLGGPAAHLELVNG